jgi:hypothetical protein
MSKLKKDSLEPKPIAATQKGKAQTRLFQQAGLLNNNSYKHLMNAPVCLSLREIPPHRERCIPQIRKHLRPKPHRLCFLAGAVPRVSKHLCRHCPIIGMLADLLAEMQNVSCKKFDQRIGVDEKSSENYHPNGRKMFKHVSNTSNDCEFAFINAPEFFSSPKIVSRRPR